MWSFFSRKKNLKVTDYVWMNSHAYRSAIGKWLGEHPEGRVFAWFSQDADELRHTVPGATADNLLVADRVTTWNIAGRPVLFAGHYPLRQREEQLAESLELQELTVYVPLDGPFFRIFSGEKIIRMMQQMGMGEAEAIRHTMVSKAIRNAQDKLARKAGNELLAASEEEWLRLNTGT